MMLNKTISLVIPMYNEREYLPIMVDKAQSVLSEVTVDYEIIIVDDCSTDGSGGLADALEKNNPRIKVIHLPMNRKLGGALKTGFSSATKEIVVYTDMDLPFDLAVLKNVLPLISEFDFIIGYRRGKRESVLRRIYSWGYNNLINYLFNLGIKDVNFALKIFPREVLDTIELKSEGSFINAEFLTKARKLGYSMKEIEVEYNLRTFGVSRLSTPAVILKILYELIRFFPEIKFFSERKVNHSRVKRLYKEITLKERVYNSIRLRTCPFDLIMGFVPKEGVVLDLGCGTGLFLNLLSTRPNKNLFFGLDWDRRKINAARKSINQRKEINFGIGDVFKNDIGLPLNPDFALGFEENGLNLCQDKACEQKNRRRIQCDTPRTLLRVKRSHGKDLETLYQNPNANSGLKAKCVVIIDVLYYLNLSQKREFLKKCFSLLEKDGVMIVKDIERKLNFKFLWNFLQELLVVRIFRFTLAKGIYFETRNNFLSLFREIGFTADSFDLNKGYFYPHILYVCKK